MHHSYEFKWIKQEFDRKVSLKIILNTIQSDFRVAYLSWNARKNEISIQTTVTGPSVKVKIKRFDIKHLPKSFTWTMKTRTSASWNSMNPVIFAEANVLEIYDWTSALVERHIFPSVFPASFFPPPFLRNQNTAKAQEHTSDCSTFLVHIYICNINIIIILQ